MLANWLRHGRFPQQLVKRTCTGSTFHLFYLRGAHGRSTLRTPVGSRQLSHRTSQPSFTSLRYAAQSRPGNQHTIATKWCLNLGLGAVVSGVAFYGHERISFNADDAVTDKDQTEEIIGHLGPQGTPANPVSDLYTADEKEQAVEQQPATTTWTLVLRFCLQDALSYVLSITFSACTAILSISEAALMKSFFDALSKTPPTGSGESSSTGMGGFSVAILKLVLVVIGESVCAALASSVLAKATNSLKQKLKQHLLHQLLVQEEGYFDSCAIGAITDQVNEYVNQIGTALRIAFTGK